VLFDLDGTLSDSLPGIAWSLNEGRRELGYESVSEASVRGWLGQGAAMLAARSLGHEDVGDPAVRRLTAVYLRHNEAGAPARSRLFPGAADLLARLRARGVRIGLTTNKPRGATASLLRGLGAEGAFDAVVTPEDAGAHKPDPAFVAYALRLLGVAARDALVVGDGLPDVDVARAAGVPVVALLGGYGDRAELAAAGADWCAEDVAEVARRMGLAG
jgi:phosphoglycolate phosphatase